VDKWALYTIGQYCDERVPNGYGGTECRFSFNGVINSQQDAYTVLNAVASCFRGMPYWAAGAITFTNDAPTGYTDTQNQAGAYSTPVAIFGPANVVNGDFTYEGTAEKARHSIALVSWNDPRDSYKQGIEPVEIPELVQRYGQRTIRVTAYGCTSRSQAHRFGLWILASEQNETETVTFTTGLDYADVTPGSIIGISDPHRTGNTWAGRVISASYYDITTGDVNWTIQLDRTFTFDPANSYFITYQNPSGEGIIQRQITGFGTVAGLSVVQVNDGSSVIDLPVTNSMYIISSITSDYRLFRVLSNKEQKGYQFEITAVQHEPKKFDQIDQGQPLIPPGGTPWSSWPVGLPALGFFVALQHLSWAAVVVGMGDPVDGQNTRPACPQWCVVQAGFPAASVTRSKRLRRKRSCFLDKAAPSMQNHKKDGLPSLCEYQNFLTTRTTCLSNVRQATPGVDNLINRRCLGAELRRKIALRYRAVFDARIRCILVSVNH
jgi:predicted phage tail protein